MRDGMRDGSQRSEDDDEKADGGVSRKCPFVRRCDAELTSGTGRHHWPVH